MRSRLLTLLASAPAAEAPGVPYRERLLADHGTGLLVYWPFDDASGTTAADASGNNRNGTYSGVTLGVTGIGDGATAARFDVSSSTMNGVGSSNGLPAALAATIATAGTVQAWFKMGSSGAWSDGLAHYIWEIQATAQNRISALKSATNTITLAHRGSGAPKQNTATLSDLLWHHVATTWDTAADQVKTYLDGVQFGSTLTGIGVFAGTPNLIRIGSLGSSNGPWSGDLAHPAIWSVALDAAAIADLATVNP